MTRPVSIHRQRLAHLRTSAPPASAGLTPACTAGRSPPDRPPPCPPAQGQCRSLQCPRTTTTPSRLHLPVAHELRHKVRNIVKAALGKHAALFGLKHVLPPLAVPEDAAQPVAASLG